MTPSRRSRAAYVGAVAWLVLTVALVTWWLVFGLMQASRLREAGGPLEPQAAATERMLLWEGGVLIGLLVAGGIVLIVAIRREHRRREAIETFFMAFTHDLKTALASLQLQAESLQEDLPGAAGNPNMQRLMKDAVRLQLQLENSLYLAQPDGRLHLEAVQVGRIVESAGADWPDLDVRIVSDGRVLADPRAFAAVLRNLLQNAAVHGGATEVRVDVSPAPDGRVSVVVADNGQGADPQVVRALGAPFTRRAAVRGTGVGLFVSRELVSRMEGDLSVANGAGRGFVVTVEIQEGSAEGAA